jgi:hypothetical protein
MTARNFAKAAARDRMRERGTESINGASSAASGQRRAFAGQGRATKPAPDTQHTLAEVDKFWRDRSGRAIVVRLTEYNGHALVDLRTFFTADDGTLRPAKGLACSVRLLPQLLRAVEKARTKAIELGLIDPEADHE